MRNLLGKRILITGGAGFIGSALVRYLINNTDSTVMNVDKLTYAGNLDSLTEVSSSTSYHFERVDVCDSKNIKRILADYKPNCIVHLAAESHVDRSIEGPSEFITTNIIGTYTLLEAALEYWKQGNSDLKKNFLFHNISTDEVYGSLGRTGLFTESSAYKPNSPYSSSKAAADHIVNAWHHTYSLPTVITNCSNNYGPYQYPEKLIPLVILNALAGKSLPVYGDGSNIRDWLHVNDHVQGILLVLEKGQVGETYNIGGNNEITNIALVNRICQFLDEMLEKPKASPHSSLIKFVQDRPGHDKRYAIDGSKISSELHWKPKYSIDSGLRETIQWYIDNQDWCAKVTEKKYSGERLGILDESQS